MTHLPDAAVSRGFRRIRHAPGSRPHGDDATVVTEVFDYGPLPEDLLRDSGAWSNGTNSGGDRFGLTTTRFERANEHPTNRKHAALRKVEIGHVSLFGQRAYRT